jgi:hypothetical protein
LGVWRKLGYAYAGLNILIGFILIGVGVSVTTQPIQPSLGTGTSFGMFNQIGGLVIIYGGLSGVMMGILLIWGLVKSGQIESMEQSLKKIAATPTLPDTVRAQLESMERSLKKIADNINVGADK